MTRRIRSAGSDISKYLAGLRRKGFEITMSGGHWSIRRGGRLVARVAASPSDGNALRVIKRDVARGLSPAENLHGRRGGIMIKGTRVTYEHDTYTFGEREFKDLLGIGDDPNGVLVVSSGYDGTIVVTMQAGDSRETGPQPGEFHG